MSSSSSLSRLVLAALGALLISTGPGQAACDPSSDPDKSDIANARAAVAANCDCIGAASRGAYVRCAVEQADATLQNPTCRGAVERCAARSTCGKPGFVTCCQTTSAGLPKCKVTRDAEHCTQRAGCTSCCDACPAPGSGPSCPISCSFLTKWGTQGSGDGQFEAISSVGVDGSGHVFVADTYNNRRIQKFKNNGIFVTKWGSPGSGDGQFGGGGPKGVAVDGSGNVFVADLGNNRIQEFTNTGTFLTKWGSPGSGDGQFYGGFPAGVAVDGSGNVFAADPGNSRIQIFAPCP